MTKLAGHCACGRVRFETDGDPRFIAHCHCENCRRAHGSGAVTWAGFTQEQLRVTDESSLASWETPTGSLRRFCSNCGSPLFFSGPRWPGEVHIAVAHFASDLPRLPNAHAYADRSPDWFPICDELAQYGGPNGNEPL